MNLQYYGGRRTVWYGRLLHYRMISDLRAGCILPLVADLRIMRTIRVAKRLKMMCSHLASAWYYNLKKILRYMCYTTRHLWHKPERMLPGNVLIRSGETILN